MVVRHGRLQPNHNALGSWHDGSRLTLSRPLTSSLWILTLRASFSFSESTMAFFRDLISFTKSSLSFLKVGRPCSDDEGRNVARPPSRHDSLHWDLLAPPTVTLREHARYQSYILDIKGVFSRGCDLCVR